MLSLIVETATKAKDAIVPLGVAILLFFWAWRDAKVARAAIAKAAPSTAAVNPLVQAVSAAWDRDQQERFLQMIERIAKAQESMLSETRKIASAQSALADQRSKDMQDSMDELLDRMERQEKTRR